MNEQVESYAIALITACHAKDYQVMAQLLNELTLGNTAATLASMSGMASSMLDHLSEHMQIEPAALLHRLGIEAATPE